MLENLCKIIACHMIGDYVLQSDFIARTKGKNWYHLFVHCVLYCVPFAVVFGLDYRLVNIFIFHIMIDAAKARYKVLPYWADQLAHYATGLIYLAL